MNMEYKSATICMVWCYLCNKECSDYMVFWDEDYFCSTECVSSYETFNQMVDYFKDKK